MRFVLLIAFLLSGCATFGNAPEPLEYTPTGEVPTVCYVQARHFHGLVPIACNEANMIRGD